MHMNNSTLFSDSGEFLFPLHGVKTVFRHWAGLVVFMLAGALIGFLIHFFNPPVYSAQGEISFVLDYSQTGEMTDIEQDIAIVTAGDIIQSDQSMALAHQLGKKSGLDDAFTLVLNQNATLERYNFTYRLIVTDTDREKAESWVKVWVQAASQVLSEAQSYAVQAKVLSEQVDKTASCLGFEQPVHPECYGKSHPEILQNMNQLIDQLVIVRQSSMAYYPAMNFGVTRAGAAGQAPVRRQKGLLVFSGAMIGAVLFIVGINLKPNQAAG